MEQIFTFCWQMGVILLLVFANGFFVASEFAIVKVRSSQLKPLLNTGDWRVPIALNVTNHLDAYLSATQLGITLASLALGAWGKPFMAHWIAPLLEKFSITSPVAADSISLAIAFAVISFLHIILGELAPKSLAIQKPRPVTLWIAPLLVAFYYVFLPFIYVLNGTANLMLRAVGIPPAAEGDHAFSMEELNIVLMHSRHSHPGDQLINKLMLKAVRMKETTAEQIMFPREQIVVLWKNKTLQENLSLAQKAGYSRFPFCGESLGDVLGVIHAKEMLWQYQALGDQTTLTSIIHPILTFTKKTKLPTMLELFRKSRNHLAMVVDENQELLGLVSFEDVLEELVGDIRDEFDIEKGPFYERTTTSVVVDADLPLRDLESETAWGLNGQPADTVEKWCLRHWNRRPHDKETIQVGDIQIIAEETCASGLRRVRMVKLDEGKVQSA